MFLNHSSRARSHQHTTRRDTLQITFMVFYAEVLAVKQFDGFFLTAKLYLYIDP